MKKLLIAAATALALMPRGAAAQERAGDAALGALSGAIVLGPVGAVAGALVGYTAGPSIARAWGLKGSEQRPPARTLKRATAEPPKQAPAGSAPSSQPPAPRSGMQAPATQTAAAQGASRETRAPSGQPVAPSAPPSAMPPVQALE